MSQAAAGGHAARAALRVPKKAKMIDVGEAIKLQQHAHPPSAAAYAAAEPQHRRSGPAKHAANGAAGAEWGDRGGNNMEEGRSRKRGRSPWTQEQPRRPQSLRMAQSGGGRRSMRATGAACSDQTWPLCLPPGRSSCCPCVAPVVLRLDVAEDTPLRLPMALLLQTAAAACCRRACSAPVLALPLLSHVQQPEGPPRAVPQRLRESTPPRRLWLRWPSALQRRARRVGA